MIAAQGKQTPVFVRFSTVAGERGSKDTVRDVRGFAIKFYTDQGNWDLVANNMPVFFIQDAIKFPDLVHAVKPVPNQTSTAAICGRRSRQGNIPNGLSGCSCTHQAGDDADTGDVGIDDPIGHRAAGVHALVVLVRAEILDFSKVVHAPGPRGGEDVFGGIGRGWRTLAEGIDQFKT